MWAYAAALCTRRGVSRRKAGGDLLRLDADVAWEEAGGNDETEVAQLYESCVENGVRVVTVQDPDFPSPLFFSGGVPILFVRGSLSVLGQRRVGIIGTRTPTPSGVYTARDFGEQLAAHGVAVVSGLAKGIDGAAHDGMRARHEMHPGDGAAGRPIAVVGSGLDIVYPKANRKLWEWVGECGVLLSEYPPGAPAEAHHFPQRNRIIASLSEIIVVVESRTTGGSMITVREAIRRGVDVHAVPGSPRVASAGGTNLLIQQGCGTVTDATDILAALSLEHSRTDLRRVDDREHPESGDLDVLEACSNGPVTLDQLMIATGRELSSIAVSLGRLHAQGWVMEERGWWEALLLGRGRHAGYCIT
jgi:DNA processing protein